MLGFIKQLVNGFKKMVAFIISLANILPQIINFVKKVFKILKMIVTNPFQTFIPGILYFLGMVFSFILRIDLNGLYYGSLIMGIIFWLISNWIGWLRIVYNFILRIIFGLGILLQMLLKAITRKDIYSFWYRNFQACENDPKAWFTHSNYQYRNYAKRMLFCQKECGNGQVPGVIPFTCDKVPKEIPIRCPNAYIKYISENSKTSVSKFYYPSITNIKDKSTLDEVNKYFGVCSRKMKHYDPISVGLCRRLAVGLDQENKGAANLEGLCYQTYCTRGEYDAFCNNINIVSNGSITEQTIQALKGTSTLMICVIVVNVAALSIICGYVFSDHIKDFAGKARGNADKLVTGVKSKTTNLLDSTKDILNTAKNAAQPLRMK